MLPYLHEAIFLKDLLLPWQLYFLHEGVKPMVFMVTGTAAPRCPVLQHHHALSRLGLGAFLSASMIHAYTRTTTLVLLVRWTHWARGQVLRHIKLKTLRTHILPARNSSWHIPPLAMSWLVLSCRRGTAGTRTRYRRGCCWPVARKACLIGFVQVHKESSGRTAVLGRGT